MVEKTKKKVLITGISGMLGRDLAPILVPLYEVVGVDIRPSEMEGVKCLCADLVDREKLAGIFETEKPWLVIHAAAYTDVDGCEKDPLQAEKLNVRVTENVVFCCRKAGSKLIYISTDYVFDGKKTSSYIESDPTNPLNVYGSSKLAGEKAVSGLKENLIIRTSWLFGRQGKNFVATIIDKARQLKRLEVVDDQRGCPTYTVSLSEALTKMIRAVFESDQGSGKYGIYHISNSGSCSWYEFAKEIVALNKISAEVIPVDSLRVSRPAKRPAFSVMSTLKLEQLTGLKMISWQEALKQYCRIG